VSLAIETSASTPSHHYSLHTKEAATQIKILALCGGSGRDSLNQKLLDIASLGAAAADAQVSLIRWLDFPLPIYDGDWEKRRRHDPDFCERQCDHPNQCVHG
jgi:hypothetical protein